MSPFRPRPRQRALWRHIAITGASSGIGAALARALAGPDTAFSLAGRDAGRLARVVEECRSRGAEAWGTVVDVAQRATLEDWLASRSAPQPIDLLIASAGITDEFGCPPQDVAQTNFVGVINTVETALPWMAGGGQVALLSSLASWRAQPNAPAYAASKAAVRLYGEAIRSSLDAAGMVLSVVCPDVYTPMLDRRKEPERRGLAPERAAELIIAGLVHRRATIVFPRTPDARVRLMALLSPSSSPACARQSVTKQAPSRLLPAGDLGRGRCRGRDHRIQCRCRPASPTPLIKWSWAELTLPLLRRRDSLTALHPLANVDQQLAVVGIAVMNPSAWLSSSMRPNPAISFPA